MRGGFEGISYNLSRSNSSRDILPKRVFWISRSMDHFVLNTSRHRYQRGGERSSRVILEQSLWQTSKKERPETGVQQSTQSRVLDLIKRISVYYFEKYASVDSKDIRLLKERMHTFLFTILNF